MQSELSTLNQKFGIEGQLSFRDAGDGFIVIDIQNDFCTASVALQGAHLMSWQPTGEQPVIWMSPVAQLAAGKSIRGGVPICWPWFGAHASQAAFSGHGFARTVMWQLIAATSDEQGATVIRLSIAEIKTEQWPADVPVEIKMVIGKTLEMELITRNHSAEVVVVGDALHTYFAVSDVSQINIRGLDGCDYIDKVGADTRSSQQGIINIHSEVDRIYLDQGQDVVIEDPGQQRRIIIEKRNSHSTIVWNPWIDKCRRMGDFGSDDGYLTMVCVESANADEDVVTLGANESHHLWVRYSVEQL